MAQRFRFLLRGGGFGSDSGKRFLKAADSNFRGLEGQAVVKAGRPVGGIAGLCQGGRKNRGILGFRGRKGFDGCQGLCQLFGSGRGLPGGLLQGRTVGLNNPEVGFQIRRGFFQRSRAAPKRPSRSRADARWQQPRAWRRRSRLRASIPAARRRAPHRRRRLQRRPLSRRRPSFPLLPVRTLSTRPHPASASLRRSVPAAAAAAVVAAIAAAAAVAAVATVAAAAVAAAAAAVAGKRSPRPCHASGHGTGC